MLWDVVRALASDEGSAMMAEAYSHSPHGTAYYTADHTRPLSIVNCDNRLVASAMRIRWEDILDNWVSDLQRGFLPGRSMLSNVIDIDLNGNENL